MNWTLTTPPPNPFSVKCAERIQTARTRKQPGGRDAQGKEPGWKAALRAFCNFILQAPSRICKLELITSLTGLAELQLQPTSPLLRGNFPEGQL